MNYKSIIVIASFWVMSALQAMETRKSPDRMKPLARDLYEMFSQEFNALHHRFDVLEKKLECVSQLQDSVEQTAGELQELKNQLRHISGCFDTPDTSEGDQTDPEIVAVLEQHVNEPSFEEYSEESELRSKRK